MFDNVSVLTGGVFIISFEKINLKILNFPFELEVLINANYNLNYIIVEFKIFFRICITTKDYWFYQCLLSGPLSLGYERIICVFSLYLLSVT